MQSTDRGNNIALGADGEWHRGRTQCDVDMHGAVLSSIRGDVEFAVWRRDPSQSSEQDQLFHRTTAMWKSKHIRTGQSGIFKCTAANVAGQGVAQIHIQVVMRTTSRPTGGNTQGFPRMTSAGDTLGLPHMTSAAGETISSATSLQGRASEVSTESGAMHFEGQPMSEQETSSTLVKDTEDRDLERKPVHDSRLFQTRYLDGDFTAAHVITSSNAAVADRDRSSSSSYGTDESRDSILPSSSVTNTGRDIASDDEGEAMSRPVFVTDDEGEVMSRPAIVTDDEGEAMSRPAIVTPSSSVTIAGRDITSPSSSVTIAGRDIASPSSSATIAGRDINSTASSGGIVYSGISSTRGIVISDGNMSTANHSSIQTDREPADAYPTSSGESRTESSIAINSSQPFIPSTHSRLPTSQVTEPDTSIFSRSSESSVQQL